MASPLQSVHMFRYLLRFHSFLSMAHRWHGVLNNLKIAVADMDNFELLQKVNKDVYGNRTRYSNMTE